MEPIEIRQKKYMDKSECEGKFKTLYFRVSYVKKCFKFLAVVSLCIPLLAANINQLNM